MPFSASLRRISRGERFWSARYFALCRAKFSSFIKPSRCISATAAAAERAVARALAGSCEVPLGAYAVMREGRLWLRGFVARPDGSEIVRAEREGAPANADALGRALADDLRGQGAEAILADIG